MELRYFPVRVVHQVLDGYRSVAVLDGDDTAEERLMWDKLTGALRRLLRQPDAEAGPR